MDGGEKRDDDTGFGSHAGEALRSRLFSGFRRFLD
jgi:hypothetical protein